MKADIDIETDEKRLRPEKSEVERLWASNEKAKKLLGWTPRYGELAGFRKGLSHTVDWFTSSQHMQSYKSDRYNI
jgi:dTDP-glucose 4,6-dehydratase